MTTDLGRDAMATRQAPASRLAGLNEPASGTRVVLAGGGPRTTSQAEAEIDFLFEHRNDFERIQNAGGHYDIQTVVVERQDEGFLGRGNAWGPNQGGGTVNTGAEEAGQSYANRLESYTTRNRDALEFAYGRDNPVALSTLTSAFAGGDAPGDGRPTTARGVMTRADQGFENLEHFHLHHRRAEIEFPFYKLMVLTNTSAEAIDLSDPHKPALALADAKTKESVGTLTGDVVRLNTGTTVASPISDAAVLAYSFIQPMDDKALDRFLESRDLLDSDGRLKEGATLALGGSGLSAYDQVLALQGSMNLFESDPNSRIGYRITDEARRKYAGAITFISNTEGKWIPPRHVGKAAQWDQRTNGLVGTEELHAAFLHDKGQKVFTDWNDVVMGSIALALNMTPKAIADSGLSTKDLLNVYHQRNEFHAQKLEEAAGLTARRKLGNSRSRRIPPTGPNARPCCRPSSGWAWSATSARPSSGWSKRHRSRSPVAWATGCTGRSSSASPNSKARPRPTTEPTSASSTTGCRRSRRRRGESMSSPISCSSPASRRTCRARTATSRRKTARATRRLDSPAQRGQRPTSTRSSSRRRSTDRVNR